MMAEGARRAALATALLAAFLAPAVIAAPLSETTEMDVYDSEAGCYYNFQHYGEGDRIMTNEPCLNCTCHNRMLMCYLRVCPFTKPIGQDCTVEKRGDQCCPIITCPDVPVDLLTSTMSSVDSTEVGHHDNYGCSIDNKFYSDGAQVPSDSNKPCELCYCIRNMTACVMQECTLHVEGCTPVYQRGTCCPVRYSCDHPDDEGPLMIDDMTTTVRPTTGFILTTTLAPGFTQECSHHDKVYEDGAQIPTDKPCEHCYCMKGDIVCVVQECGAPMENEGKNCTAIAPEEGQCCPNNYVCDEKADEHMTTVSDTIVLTTTPKQDTDGKPDTAQSTSTPTSEDKVSDAPGSTLEPEKSDKTTVKGEKEEAVTPSDALQTTLSPNIGEAEPQTTISHDMSTLMSTIRDNKGDDQKPEDQSTVQSSTATKVPQHRDDVQEEQHTESSIAPMAGSETDKKSATTPAEHDDDVTQKAGAGIESQTTDTSIVKDDGHKQTNIKDQTTKSSIDKESEHTTVYDEQSLETTSKLSDDQEMEIITKIPITKVDHVIMDSVTEGDKPKDDQHKITEDGESDEIEKTTEETDEHVTIKSIDDEKPTQDDNISQQHETTPQSDNTVPEGVTITTVKSITETHSTIVPKKDTSAESSEEDTSESDETEDDKGTKKDGVTKPPKSDDLSGESDEIEDDKDNKKDGVTKPPKSDDLSGESDEVEDDKDDKKDGVTKPPKSDDLSGESDEVEDDKDDKKDGVTKPPKSDDLSGESDEVEDDKDDKKDGVTKPPKSDDLSGESDEVEDDKDNKKDGVTKPPKSDDLSSESDEHTVSPHESKKPVDKDNKKDGVTKPPKSDDLSSESDEHTVSPHESKKPVDKDNKKDGVTKPPKSDDLSSGSDEHTVAPHESKKPVDKHQESEINTTESAKATSPLSIESITSSDEYKKDDKSHVTEKINLDKDDEEITDKTVIDEDIFSTLKPESSEDGELGNRYNEAEEESSGDKDKPVESVTKVSKPSEQTPEDENDLGSGDSPIEHITDTEKPVTQSSLGDHVTSPQDHRFTKPTEHTDFIDNDYLTTISPDKISEEGSGDDSIHDDKEKDESISKPSTDKPTKDISEIPKPDSGMPIEPEKVTDDNISHQKPTVLPEELTTIHPQHEAITTKAEITPDIQTTTQTIHGDLTQSPIQQVTEDDQTSDGKPEMTTLNPANEQENEIHENEQQYPQTEDEPARIPGEGDCLVDGMSYRNGSQIPTMSKCQSSCHCMNSILKCQHIECPPPPSNMVNCQSVYHGRDTCCPMYTCEHVESVTIESDNQMSDISKPTTERVTEKQTMKTDINDEQATTIGKLDLTTVHSDYITTQKSIIPSITDDQIDQHVDKVPESSSEIPDDQKIVPVSVSTDQSQEKEKIPHREEVSEIPIIPSVYVPDCGTSGCSLDTKKPEQMPIDDQKPVTEDYFTTKQEHVDYAHTTFAPTTINIRSQTEPSDEIHTEKSPLGEEISSIKPDHTKKPDSHSESTTNRIQEKETEIPEIINEQGEKKPELIDGLQITTQKSYTQKEDGTESTTFDEVTHKDAIGTTVPSQGKEPSLGEKTSPKEPTGEYGTTFAPRAEYPEGTTIPAESSEPQSQQPLDEQIEEHDYTSTPSSHKTPSDQESHRTDPADSQKYTTEPVKIHTTLHDDKIDHKSTPAYTDGIEHSTLKSHGEENIPGSDEETTTEHSVHAIDDSGKYDHTTKKEDKLSDDSDSDKKDEQNTTPLSDVDEFDTTEDTIDEDKPEYGVDSTDEPHTDDNVDVQTAKPIDYDKLGESLTGRPEVTLPGKYVTPTNAPIDVEKITNEPEKDMTTEISSDDKEVTHPEVYHTESVKTPTTVSIKEDDQQSTTKSSVHHDDKPIKPSSSDDEETAYQTTEPAFTTSAGVTSSVEQITNKVKVEQTTVSIDDVNKIGVSVLPTDSVDEDCGSQGCSHQKPIDSNVKPGKQDDSVGECGPVGCQVEAEYTRVPIDKSTTEKSQGGHIDQSDKIPECDSNGCEGDDEQNIIVDDVIKPQCGPNGCIDVPKPEIVPTKDSHKGPEKLDPQSEVTKQPIKPDQKPCEGDDCGEIVTSAIEKEVERVTLKYGEKLPATEQPVTTDKQIECENGICVPKKDTDEVITLRPIVDEITKLPTEQHSTLPSVGIDGEKPEDCGDDTCDDANKSKPQTETGHVSDSTEVYPTPSDCGDSGCDDGTKPIDRFNPTTDELEDEGTTIRSPSSDGITKPHEYIPTTPKYLETITDHQEKVTEIPGKISDTTTEHKTDKPETSTATQDKEPSTKKDVQDTEKPDKDVTSPSTERLPGTTDIYTDQESSTPISSVKHETSEETTPIVSQIPEITTIKLDSDKKLPEGITESSHQTLKPSDEDEAEEYTTNKDSDIISVQQTTPKSSKTPGQSPTKSGTTVSGDHKETEESFTTEYYEPERATLVPESHIHVPESDKPSSSSKDDTEQPTHTDKYPEEVQVTEGHPRFPEQEITSTKTPDIKKPILPEIDSPTDEGSSEKYPEKPTTVKYEDASVPEFTDKQEDSKDQQKPLESDEKSTRSPVDVISATTQKSHIEGETHKPSDESTHSVIDRTDKPKDGSVSDSTSGEGSTYTTTKYYTEDGSISSTDSNLVESETKKPDKHDDTEHDTKKPSTSETAKPGTVFDGEKPTEKPKEVDGRPTDESTEDDGYTKSVTESAIKTTVSDTTEQEKQSTEPSIESEPITPQFTEKPVKDDERKKPIDEEIGAYDKDESSTPIEDEKHIDHTTLQPLKEKDTVKPSELDNSSGQVPVKPIKDGEFKPSLRPDEVTEPTTTKSVIHDEDKPLDSEDTTQTITDDEDIHTTKKSVEKLPEVAGTTLKSTEESISSITTVKSIEDSDIPTTVKSIEDSDVHTTAKSDIEEDIQTTVKSIDNRIAQTTEGFTSDNAAHTTIKSVIEEGGIGETTTNVDDTIGLTTRQPIDDSHAQTTVKSIKEGHVPTTVKSIEDGYAPTTVKSTEGQTTIKSIDDHHLSSTVKPIEGGFAPTTIKSIDDTHAQSTVKSTDDDDVQTTVKPIKDIHTQTTLKSTEDSSATTVKSIDDSHSQTTVKSIYDDDVQTTVKPIKDIHAQTTLQSTEDGSATTVKSIDESHSQTTVKSIYDDDVQTTVKPIKDIHTQTTLKSTEDSSATTVKSIDDSQAQTTEKSVDDDEVQTTVKSIEDIHAQTTLKSTEDSSATTVKSIDDSHTQSTMKSTDDDDVQTTIKPMKDIHAQTTLKSTEDGSATTVKSIDESHSQTTVKSIYDDDVQTTVKPIKDIHTQTTLKSTEDSSATTVKSIDDSQAQTTEKSVDDDEVQTTVKSIEDIHAQTTSKPVDDSSVTTVKSIEDSPAQTTLKSTEDSSVTTVKSIVDSHAHTTLKSTDDSSATTVKSIDDSHTQTTVKSIYDDDVQTTVKPIEDVHAQTTSKPIDDSSVTTVKSIEDIHTTLKPIEDEYAPITVKAIEDIHGQTTVKSIEDEYIPTTVKSIEDIHSQTVKSIESEPIPTTDISIEDDHDQTTLKSIKDGYISTTVKAIEEVYVPTTVKSIKEGYVPTTVKPIEEGYVPTTVKSIEDIHTQTTIKSIDDDHLSSTAKPIEDGYVPTTMKSIDDSHAQTTVKSIDDSHTQTTVKSIDDEIAITTIKSIKESDIGTTMKSSDDSHDHTTLKSVDEYHTQTTVKSVDDDQLSTTLKSIEDGYVPTTDSHAQTTLKSIDDGHSQSTVMPGGEDELSTTQKSIEDSQTTVKSIEDGHLPTTVKSIEDSHAPTTVKSVDEGAHTTVKAIKESDISTTIKSIDDFAYSTTLKSIIDEHLTTIKSIEDSDLQTTIKSIDEISIQTTEKTVEKDDDFIQTTIKSVMQEKPIESDKEIVQTTVKYIDEIGTIKPSDDASHTTVKSIEGSETVKPSGEVIPTTNKPAEEEGISQTTVRSIEVETDIPLDHEHDIRRTTGKPITDTTLPPGVTGSDELSEKPSAPSTNKPESEKPIDHDENITHPTQKPIVSEGHVTEDPIKKIETSKPSDSEEDTLPTTAIPEKDEHSTESDHDLGDEVSQSTDKPLKHGETIEPTGDDEMAHETEKPTHDDEHDKLAPGIEVSGQEATMSPSDEPVDSTDKYSPSATEQPDHDHKTQAPTEHDHKLNTTKPTVPLETSTHHLLPESSIPSSTSSPMKDTTFTEKSPIADSTTKDSVFQQETVPPNLHDRFPEQEILPEMSHPEMPALPSPDEDEGHQVPQVPGFPGGSYGHTGGDDQDYEEEDQPFGPGTCRYGGKVFVSAQQIPRDDPCDFCFCFRSDIICLQQSCPPPIQHCHEEPISGFCCPRYECPVSMATVMNVTTTTTTTTTTLPPHFLSHAYKGAAQRRGCQIQGQAYKVGDVVKSASGPCLHCTCGGDGQMKCDPKVCTPEPMLRHMIAVAATTRR